VRAADNDDEGRAAVQAAVTLAPFLADYYYATGRDLADAAALDQTILDLAAAYSELPGLAQQAGEYAAQTGASEAVVAQAQRLCRQINDLLGETAAAIRNRLGVLSDQNEHHGHRRHR
jgi:hypothetical protein